mmetsp:Transcript_9450/g.15054  ORF Transcript_9450/g.15054 Transcript_9450/m.15054 type:complete len:205 (-) Transcript_9450:17-631(-)
MSTAIHPDSQTISTAYDLSFYVSFDVAEILHSGKAISLKAALPNGFLFRILPGHHRRAAFSLDRLPMLRKTTRGERQYLARTALRRPSLAPRVCSHVEPKVVNAECRPCSDGLQPALCTRVEECHSRPSLTLSGRTHTSHNRTTTALRPTFLLLQVLSRKQVRFSCTPQFLALAPYSPCLRSPSLRVCLPKICKINSPRTPNAL